MSWFLRGFEVAQRRCDRHERRVFAVRWVCPDRWNRIDALAALAR
jgi:hypothetical protein